MPHACIEVLLETTPFIPFESAVGSEQEKGKYDDDNYSDACYFYDIAAEVINDGGVHVTAKADGVLLGNKQCRFVIVEARERVVDVGFKVLKGSVNTGDWVSTGFCQNILGTYKFLMVALT